MNFLLLLVVICIVLLAKAEQPKIVRFPAWDELALKLDEEIEAVDLHSESHREELLDSLNRDLYSQVGIELIERSVVEVFVKADKFNYKQMSEQLTNVIESYGCSYPGLTGIEGRREQDPFLRRMYSTFVECNSDDELFYLYNDYNFFTIILTTRIVRKIPVTKNSFGGKLARYIPGPDHKKKSYVEGLKNSEEEISKQKKQISRVTQNYYPDNDILRCLDNNGNKNPNWYIDSLNNNHGIPDCVSLKETEVNYKCEYIHRSGAGATVFVIDTGIDISHPEFASKAILPITVPILNAADLDPSETQFDDISSHGHGIASLIAGESHGLAPAVTLYSLKIVGFGGWHLPSYAWPNALDFVLNITNGTNTVKRPHMILSGFTHIEEANTCSGYFTGIVGPLGSMNCAFIVTFKYLQYIAAGGIYVAPGGNGIEYYRDPTYTTNPTVVGFHICDYALFSNDYAYGNLYYPMYMLMGNEWSNYFNGINVEHIRPIRVGAHDKKGYNAKYMIKHYFSINPEESTLDFGTSNYGQSFPTNPNVSCIDYHAPSSFMESFPVPVSPSLLVGSYEDCDGWNGVNGCPDEWNGPGTYYHEYPSEEFSATGMHFPHGYRKGTYSGTSFAVPLVGAALIGTMLRQHSHFYRNITPEFATREAIRLVDIDINFNATDRYRTTIDSELTIEYESLDNNYGRNFLTGQWSTKKMGGPDLDIPKTKNIRLRCTNPNTIIPLYANVDLYDYGS